MYIITPRFVNIKGIVTYFCHKVKRYFHYIICSKASSAKKFKPKSQKRWRGAMTLEEIKAVKNPQGSRDKAMIAVFTSCD
ncbi:MAG: hypothetical protein LBM41_05325 [Ruminococcus sp.]|jgi:hypothetical protein|nr:hypothetical protein [Ruminococcus sp.]